MNTKMAPIFTYHGYRINRARWANCGPNFQRDWRSPCLLRSLNLCEQLIRTSVQVVRRFVIQVSSLWALQATRLQAAELLSWRISPSSSASIETPGVTARTPRGRLLGGSTPDYCWEGRPWETFKWLAKGKSIRSKKQITTSTSRKLYANQRSPWLFHPRFMLTNNIRW